MKHYRPITPGRRGANVISYKEKVTTATPHKKLTRGLKNTSGRNHYGRITSQARGGGNKKKYREIDFLYEKRDIPARIETIEYDPYRSGYIALVVYRDGARRYILAPKSVEVGGTFLVSENAPVLPGNRLPLRKIPVGTFVYNIEVKPMGGAKMARAAGNYAEVIAQDAGYTHLKMPSSEVRKVPDMSWASVGEVSNDEHRLTNLGKAGRNRHLGRRPKNRGSARNAVDHPYGGGEGRMGRGHRRARTITGKPTGKGQKSRKPKKYSNPFIVRRRKVGKR